MKGPSISHPVNIIVEDPDSLFATDNTSTRFSAAGKVATITVYRVMDVTICKPDDSSWTELEESRVVLDDEELHIKIEIIPKVKSMAQCRQMFGDSLWITTSGTCPLGAPVPLVGKIVSSTTSGKSEVQITKNSQQLKTRGVLPYVNHDGVNEMAWIDIVKTSGQSLEDSKAFSTLGYAFRGKATFDTSNNLGSTPPNSVPSETYMKSAGCELLTVTYGQTTSNRRQIMNQSDWFYFSGHGNHATGQIQGGFTPSMVSQYWNRDLDCVIIAGCAVLDIRNYRFNSLGLLYRWKHRAWKGAYLGEMWEETGVKYLLGYALKAPLDTDGGSSIAFAFVDNIQRGKDIITSWRNANDTDKGRNACVIDCSKTPHQFWFWDESSGNPIWTNKTKGPVSW